MNLEADVTRKEKGDWHMTRENGMPKQGQMQMCMTKLAETVN